MTRRRVLWFMLPEPVRRLTADLVAVIALTVATVIVVVVPVINETPLRVGFGLLFVLFLPGYAFIAALFPEEGTGPTPEAEATDSDFGDRGIDGIERVALSFGLSIAIVPLIGLVLNFSPWGIRLLPVLFSVAGFTLVAAVVGAIRRWELPAEDRLKVPYREWIAVGKAEVFEPDYRFDAALTFVVAVSVVLAVGSVGYAVTAPPPGEQFTEFYLLTEDEQGGLVADNYPTDFEVGQAEPLIVGIGNQEHEEVHYTVVVELQRVAPEENATVVERSEVARFEVTVAHNETWHQQHTIAPDLIGDNLRLQYLLYIDDPQDEPDRETAYRDPHLWIEVEESNG